MHNWTNSHLYFSHHPRSPRDFTQTIESYTYFYNFMTQRVCNVLIIVNFLHIFVFVEFTRDVGQGSHGDHEMKFHDFSITFHDHFLRIP